MARCQAGSSAGGDPTARRRRSASNRPGASPRQASVRATAIFLVGGAAPVVVSGDGTGSRGAAIAFGLAVVATVHLRGEGPDRRALEPGAQDLGAGSQPLRTMATTWLVSVACGVVAGSAVFLLAQAPAPYRASMMLGDPRPVPGPGDYVLGAGVMLEIALIGLMVFVVLSATRARPTPTVAGVLTGLAVAQVDAVGAVGDAAPWSVVRSLATALVDGPTGWDRIWSSLVFPLVGTAAGLLVWMLLHEDDASPARLLPLGPVGTATLGGRLRAHVDPPHGPVPRARRVRGVS